MKKKLRKTTTLRSKNRSAGKDIGWGIDQAKYDAARKKSPRADNQKLIPLPNGKDEPDTTD